MKKAVILLSGGLDSATVLYHARAAGYDPYGLIFRYGQRHHKEIRCARQLARTVKAPVEVVRIQLPWQGSSLLNQKMALPGRAHIDPDKIPSTYVPARNIIFLSFAVSYAEVIRAKAIFIGANAIDYSGYPDCRPEFFNAFRRVIRTGMKSGVEGETIAIEAPLLKKSKAQIIRMGQRLGVPYEKTWSCYKGESVPCGRCESCRLRRKGFEEAGMEDPAWTPKS